MVHLVYEVIIGSLEAKNDDTDSDPYETARIADTPETKQTASESLQSMYYIDKIWHHHKINQLKRLIILLLICLFLKII